MRTCVALWVCLAPACAADVIGLGGDAGPVVDGGQTAGPGGGVRADGGAPRGDGGAISDGGVGAIVDAGVDTACARDRLTTAVTRGGAREVASELLLQLPSDPDPSRLRTAIFTEGPGALWLDTGGPLPDTALTRARALLARAGADARPLCGEGHVTWIYRAPYVRASFEALASLPSCAEGPAVEGRVEACSDPGGRRCGGAPVSLVSTVPGFPVVDPGSWVFGGRVGGPYTFDLGSVTGVGGRRGGYALFAQGPTLFCVGSVTYTSGGERMPSRLVLSGLRRLGPCAEATPEPDATLEACVGAP